MRLEEGWSDLEVRREFAGRLGRALARSQQRCQAALERDEYPPFRLDMGGEETPGHFRLFRYELRRWNDGVILDVDAALDSPVHVSSDARDARRLLELVPAVPTLVWGRDELRAGEMWNSNSVVSWLLARAGLNTDTIRPPAGGRAPGWKAGLVAAKRPPLKQTSLEVRRSQVS